MKNNLFSSFGYALQGIMKLFRTERNARIHLLATVWVIILGIYFDVDTIEWCLLVLAIGMVLGAEGFNTAIENMIDLMSPEICEKAGSAKDLAAGAVLLSATCAAIIGVLIFGPRLLLMF